MGASIRLRKGIVTLSILMLILAHPFSVMAAAQVNFSEEIQTDQDTITYEIRLSPDANICGLSLEINYSEEEIEITECNLGSLLEGGIGKCNSSIQGKVILTYISMTPLEDEGTILSIVFKSVSDVNKKISIDCAIAECIDQNCDEIPYTFVQKEITNPLYVQDVENQTNSTDSNSAANNQQQTAEETAGGSDQKDETVKESTKPSENTDGVSSAEPPGGTVQSNENDDPDIHQKESSEVIKDDGTEETITTGTDDPQDGSEVLKTVRIVGCVSFLALIALLYFFIVKPIIAKRRNGNEKR